MSRRSDRAAGRSGRPLLLPVLLVGAFALAGVAAVLATQEPAKSPASKSAAFSLAVVSGTPLPALPEQGPDPALGRPAPSLEGVAFNGQTVRLGADGRPKAIVFLAHWCPHCQAEVPAVQAWLDANGRPEGVDLYSVATAIDPSRPNYPPAAWLDREGWSVPVVVDGDGQAARAYGLTGFPYWVFVGADGTVVERRAGRIPVGELQSILERLGG